MPPTGFKRSRALWDNARRPHASQADRWRSYLRVLLYELQPIRFAEVDWRSRKQAALSFLQACFRFLTETLPVLTIHASKFLGQLTLRQWMMVGGVVLYYYLVRLAHYALDAGPVVIIVTALVAIFTVGLSDEANRDGLSAYSVFNRGFQRIVGSIDEHALMAQHVGGAAAFLAPPAHRQDNDDDLPELPPPQARDRARQRIQEPALAAEAEGEEANPGEPVRPLQNRARKSGKKARRGNLEQRREMRRQREAAMAMGFNDQEEDDEMAMQRLIEEQIMAENGD